MINAQERLERMTRKLKEADHRITPQRLAILKALVESPSHPSVENIYDQVRINFPTTSLATVYKTITVLKEIDEVLELEFSNGPNRYDANKPYPHPHLICLRCRKVLDPDLSSLTEVTRKLSAETGFEIITHRLDFYGICPECRDKE
jgi:Fur family transcriptional regulator, peroxide stress response regulator